MVDVSFISLRLVLPALWPLLDAASPRARLVALVKPQFEAGRDAVKAGKGVVRDGAVALRVLDETMEFARWKLPSCGVVGTLDSPILGGDGNREFLLVLAPSAHAASAPRLLAGAALAVAEQGDEAQADDSEFLVVPEEGALTAADAAGATARAEEDGALSLGRSRQAQGGGSRRA